MLHLPECELVLEKLKTNLPPYIFYHTIDHTLDVYHTAMRLADSENVNAGDKHLLGIAAVYHDFGYLEKSDGHEELSCEKAKDYLSRYGYSTVDIDAICGIIMATKVPQQPTTLLQQIICDADMDYLGRADFIEIADLLYQEFHAQGKVHDKQQWNLIQIQFLKQHHFFTESAIATRQNTKQKNLLQLESNLK